MSSNSVTEKKTSEPSGTEMENESWENKKEDAEREGNRTDIGRERETEMKNERGASDSERTMRYGEADMKD